MGSYNFTFKPSVEKDPARVPHTTVTRVMKKIEGLALDPLPPPLRQAFRFRAAIPHQGRRLSSGVRSGQKSQAGCDSLRAAPARRVQADLTVLGLTHGSPDGAALQVCEVTVA